MRTPWLDESLATNGHAVKDNFSDWFGASRVNDGSGIPLLVFHGSVFDIDAFRAGPRDTTEGAVFFTTHPAVAVQFATSALESGASMDPLAGEVLYAVHLSIENPKVLNVKDVMGEHGHSFEKMKKAVAQARRAGHDGLLIKDVFEFDGLPAADQWAAFSSSQIKSAVGNSGLYAKKSPSLTDTETSIDLTRALKAKEISKPRRRHATISLD